jgi:hypothetical protein
MHRTRPLSRVKRKPRTAKGQKQTCAPQNSMSALPLIATAKADMKADVPSINDLSEL